MAVTLSRRAVDIVDSRLWHHLALGVHPACAIAAYKDGELVLDLYGGEINSGDGSKVAADTLFSVWSCGKPLAAACLWVLKERGKVDWDHNTNSILEYNITQNLTVDQDIQKRPLRHLSRHLHSLNLQFRKFFVLHHEVILYV